MLIKIKRFFESHLVVAAENSQDEIKHRLNLACAALLVELMHVDYNADPHEEEKIRSLLKNKFELSAEELEELLTLATEKKHEAADYYQFTSLINSHFTQEQKISLIEIMWEVAYADQAVDKYEEHLIRKIAELLHVPHMHFIQARHRADNSN